MSVISTPEALAQLAGPQAGTVWSVLVERFGVEVWRLMASRMRDLHEAENAYQEFWLALPQNALRFRPGGPDPERSARAWIMRIAYITAACRRTRRGVPLGVTMQPLQHQDGATDEQAEQDDAVMKPQPRPALTTEATPAVIEDDVERTRLIGRVHTIIGDLPEGYRRPLLLHVVAGLSYEELATDLRCTVNNARVKVHRGLKRVRELLGTSETALPDRALMSLFVPMLAFTPLAPPIPTAAAIAAKKAISTKILLSKSAANHTPMVFKAMLTAACLAVSTVIAVKALPVNDHTPARAPVTVNAPFTPSTAVSVISAPLDGLPASSAAYSLQRLRSAYQGPAFRLRVGEQQRDIGFTTSGELDLTALRLFCGTDDGFVTRWYDQSGNGVDLAQRQPARQPLLVDSGNVLLMGNCPVFCIAGAEQWLDASDTATVGSVTALVSSDKGGLYSEWKVLLASSVVYDRRYFRGEINHTTFDAVGSTPSIFYVNGRRSADSA
ncbi:MAG TPA: sigma-70 family RNA polymerase sigma factor, partial [Planctomycetota bacterium]|nr:sigma-70 family RNA polymerase sigma factor [Planctomycetota bacterium]